VTQAWGVWGGREGRDGNSLTCAQCPTLEAVFSCTHLTALNNMGLQKELTSQHTLSKPVMLKAVNAT